MYACELIQFVRSCLALYNSDTHTIDRRTGVFMSFGIKQKIAFSTIALIFATAAVIVLLNYRTTAILLFRQPH